MQIGTFHVVKSLYWTLGDLEDRCIVFTKYVYFVQDNYKNRFLMSMDHSFFVKDSKIVDIL